MSTLRVEIPEAFAPLLQKSRYKGAHGGRGGGKSHFFAEQIVLRCLQEKTQVVCIREVQNTMRESVHKLISEKIQKFGLGPQFDVLEREIRGRNGSLIIFRGMQSMNAENIKSLENFQIAWIEEAQTLSDRSFRMLRPTIRSPGSEIWASWNPRHDTDPVDVFFRGPVKHPRAVCVEVHYSDNPWPTQEMDEERERDFAMDAEMAEHVWNGGYELVSEAAYYAKLIFAAEKEGRIGEFAYNPDLPVDVSFDIGVDDYSSLVFWQNYGTHCNIIDFWEASGAGAEEVVSSALPEMNPDERARYAALADLGRAKAFRYGRFFLPHDVKNREWGAGAKSRVEILMRLGMRSDAMNIGVATDPANRIEATRRLLPVVNFANTPRVNVLLRHLRRYSRRQHTEGFYLGPKHDEHSHAADAVGEYAINSAVVPATPPKPKPKPTPRELSQVYLPGPPQPRSIKRIRI